MPLHHCMMTVVGLMFSIMDSVNVGEPLPAEIAELPLLDEAGDRHSLGDIIAGRVTVLAFLRHFGCLACQEHVNLWKPYLDELYSLGAQVVFVGNGEVDKLRNFVAKVSLAETPARALTDPTLVSYKALGFKHSVGSTISPLAVFNVVRAISRGNIQTSVEGDPLQQGGFLITNATGEVALLHREKTLGDYLPISGAMEMVKALV